MCKEDWMDLQTRVKDYLETNGVKKKHLAEVIGIYPSQFSLWLNGKYDINSIQERKIEEFLNAKL